ncbi:MAG: 4Fe-4S binding protein [Nitrospirae bacterium]|nr:4Fe-4S binding protein [Nitrospirota bacterium]
MNRKTLRMFTQGIILVAAVLIPVFDIFRFDISELKLYLLRQVWSFAPQGQYMSGAGGDPVNFIFKGIIPFILLFVSLPVWGAVLGRFLCGWFCPVGTIFEIGDFFRRNLIRLKDCRHSSRSENKEPHWAICLYGSLSVILIIIALSIMSIFFAGLIIAPSEIWRQISALELSPLFIATVSGIMILIVGTYFARIAFCSYICLFGITQTIPAIVSPFSLRVGFDTNRSKMCTNCKGCERACFMEIKPRTMVKKVNPKCINCGKCITACEQELGKKNGLFYYSFGRGEIY